MKQPKVVYNEIEQAVIGAKIAEVFCMRKDRDHKDRWQMTWGNKTALGVFKTFQRIAEEIDNGTFNDSGHGIV